MKGRWMMCCAVALALTGSRGVEAQQGGKGPKISVKHTPAPAPKAPQPSSKAEGKAEESEGTGKDKAKPPPSTTRGATWSDGPRPRRYVARRKINPNWAIATYPGFRMLPDGTSQIWIHLSKAVPIQHKAAEGSVSFILEDTYVRTYNNTHALVTTHFNTPVAAARLKRLRGGKTQLTILLREKAALQKQLVPGPRGTAYLRINIPRPTKTFAQQLVPLGVMKGARANVTPSHSPAPTRTPTPAASPAKKKTTKAQSSGQSRTKDQGKGKASSSFTFSMGD